MDKLEKLTFQFYKSRELKTQLRKAKRLNAIKSIGIALAVVAGGYCLLILMGYLIN